MKLTSMIAAVTLASVSMWFAGCATVVHGTTEKIHLNSAPAGAEVTIDNAQSLTTPADVDLTRSDPHTLVFSKAGYQEAHEALTTRGTGLVWGNLLFVGVVGAIVDESDGASNELSSDDIEVTLVPASPGEASPGRTSSESVAQKTSEDGSPNQGEAADNGVTTPAAESPATNAVPRPLANSPSQNRWTP